MKAFSMFFGAIYGLFIFLIGLENANPILSHTFNVMYSIVLGLIAGMASAKAVYLVASKQVSFKSTGFFILLLLGFILVMPIEVILFLIPFVVIMVHKGWVRNANLF